MTIRIRSPSDLQSCERTNRARTTDRRVDGSAERHSRRRLEELLPRDLLLVLVARERLAVEDDGLHVLRDERVECIREVVSALGLVDRSDALLSPGWGGGKDDGGGHIFDIGSAGCVVVDDLKEMMLLRS